MDRWGIFWLFAFVSTPHEAPVAPRRSRLPAADVAPAVCRAGYFQFASGQRFTNGCVQSRALFWCKSGRGEFAIDGVTYGLEPHDLYVLPWNRRITYQPSSRQPMYTAHVHIVPWYRPGAPWIPNVPHEPDELEFDSRARSDANWPLKPGMQRLRTEADQPLGRLIDYAIRWYHQSARDEAEARALGLLFVREVCRAGVDEGERRPSRPEELERLLVHIERGFQLAPTVQELAAIAGRSRSHVLKLFRRHLGVSAKAYLVERQLREARELLLSTTLSISEIGKSVGLPDPYHFSKLFRRRIGLAPREFRAENGPFSKPPKPGIHQPAVARPTR